MYKDIKTYIQTCDICQCRGNEIERQTLGHLKLKHLSIELELTLKNLYQLQKKAKDTLL